LAVPRYFGVANFGSGSGSSGSSSSGRRWMDGWLISILVVEKVAIVVTIVE
jgi:hypothetical protein